MPLRYAFYLLLLFTFFANSLFAQFAIICDKDGYVNVRAERSGSSAIIDKLNNQDLVCTWNEGGSEWNNVLYCKGEEYCSGYIHRSRLQMIDSIPGIKKMKEIKYNAVVAVYRCNSVHVTVTEGPFIAKEHWFTYGDEQRKKIRKIDDRYYKGKDGEMPTREFKSVKVEWGAAHSDFQQYWLDNMCEIRARDVLIYVDEKKQRIYLEATSFSDGAGYYKVMWVWEKGEVKSRLVWEP